MRRSERLWMVSVCQTGRAHHEPNHDSRPSLIPDIEAFEERVAIHIHDGGIPTDQAKDLAAQAQGFRNQAHYWAWLRVYVERKRLG